MKIAARLDDLQRRQPWLGFPIAVIYKFTEDQGPYLAALITYYGFLSLFPLLLLLASVLGFILQGDETLKQQILDSTLSQFPVIGSQLGEPQGLRGSIAGLVAGGLVAIYGALGVAQALQNALNVAWAIPRRRRPNALKARLRSLSVIGIGGIAVLATTVLSALGSSAGQFGTHLGAFASVGVIAGSVVVNAAVFVAAFKVCTNEPRPWRDIVPGALLATAIWQLLQLFGTAFIGREVKGADATYGTFALVLGLIGWLFLAAMGVVLSAEVNAVRAKHLYPRSLRAPFTDDLVLTVADRRVYADIARAQQFKGFQSIAVNFDGGFDPDFDAEFDPDFDADFDARDRSPRS
jgi:membrane protein